MSGYDYSKADFRKARGTEIQSQNVNQRYALGGKSLLTSNRKSTSDCGITTGDEPPVTPIQVGTPPVRCRDIQYIFPL
jgi:hypothetical protein